MNSIQRASSQELSLLSKAKSGAISEENEHEVLVVLQEALQSLLQGVGGGEGEGEAVVRHYKEGQRRILKKSLEEVMGALQLLEEAG